MKKIEREYYINDTFIVAKDVILGAYLCSNINDQLTGGIITEVEVYIGNEDKAAHSYPNKRTRRTEIQYGLGGYAYVFLVYGIHAQFCIVTNGMNISDVVLIRSIKPTVGIDIMQARRGVDDIKRLTVGPGNVCKSLGITKQQYGIDLCGDQLFLCHRDKDVHITSAKRIGIDYAEEYTDKLWRYYDNDSEFVSYKHKR